MSHAIATPVTALAVPAGVAAGAIGSTVGGHVPATSAAVATHDGHGATSGPGPGGNGHGGTDPHGTPASAGDHGAQDGEGAGGPAIPWWRRSITADMPPETNYPAYRIPWATSLGLLLFLAGIFFVGLWPSPVINLLRDASSALFAG